MIDKNNLEDVKKAVEEFLEKMTFEGKVEVAHKDQTLLLDVKTEDPQILIGERGDTLMEIQHLLKLILRKKIGVIKEPFYIDLDINDYKKKKIDYLKEMSREAADEVAQNKKEKILPAMTAYERRIVHLELSQRQDVVSESMGEEPERRIVIRPKP